MKLVRLSFSCLSGVRFGSRYDIKVYIDCSVDDFSHSHVCMYLLCLNMKNEMAG